jgi:hypothetical protein
MTDRDKTLAEIAKIIKESDAFKGFHGNLTLNIAFGEVKNFVQNESILPKKEKKG